MTVRSKAICGPADGPPLLIATMHGKETVLAPRLATLGFRALLPVGYDTDTLGTFSGDVRRPGTAFEAALEKARRACAVCGIARAVSSEGTYRPSSSAFKGAANAELLAFVDQEAGIELVEHVTNVPTRFAMGRVPPDLAAPQLQALLARIGWPAVRAIVVAGDPGAGVPAYPVFKGIGTHAALAEALSVCASLSDDGLAHLETDLRAHMNPTRMAVIAQLGDRLVARLQREGYGLAWTGAERRAAR